MKPVRTLLIAALWLYLTAPIGIGAAHSHDLRLRWRVLETPHFRIIFHQGEEQLANEAAIVAERAHGLLTQALNYTPPEKTNIVITDASDLPNGFAIPFPNPDIVVYPVHSRAGEFFNSRFDSWLDQVIFHEYGHIVDLSKVNGPGTILRSLFGRQILAPPKPMAFVEGIPIYAEFNRSGESRANDPRDAMFLRAMLLEDAFPTLGQISSDYTRDEWPPTGLLDHDFGPWLVRYIAERYGSDVLPEILERYTEMYYSFALSIEIGGPLLAINLVPNFQAEFGDVLDQTLGQSPSQVYDGFKAWLSDQFTEEIETIQADGVTETHRITELNYWSNRPVWSPDGERIAYYHSDPTRLPALRIVTADGRRDRQLRLGEVFSDPTWSPDGDTLIYEKIDLYRHVATYSDLYRYDLNTGRERRLTRGARAYNPVFLPDGEQILFAQHDSPEMGQRLAILELHTGEIRLFHQLPADTALHSFDLSPDGRRIALSLWRRGGFQDIYLMSIETKELVPLTQDRATDLDPTWSPDGRYVLFNSDRGRINNLYAYRLADGALFKVTNVLTGAFDPDVSPDGRKIVFVGYTAAGYDIRVMEFEPDRWGPVEAAMEEIPSWAGFPVTEYPIHRYNPLPLMLPKSWVPLIGSDPEGMLTQFGVEVSGTDPLRHHTYVLQGGFDYTVEEPFYAFLYTNDRFTPSFTLLLNQGRNQTNERFNEQLLEVNLPLVTRFFSAQQLTLGGRRTEVGTAPARGGLYAIWSQDSISGIDRFQDRRNILIAGETRADAGENLLGGFVDGFPNGPTEEWAILDWRERLRLPLKRNHELAARLFAGWSEIPGFFQLGGSGESLTLDGFSILLRGYPSQAFTGASIAAGSLEYRFPIVSIHNGTDFQPVFYDDLRGSLFIDGGLVADIGETLDSAGLVGSAGFELNLTLTTNYVSRILLRFGWAQGFDQLQPLFYIGLGTSF
ncbi:MAG: DPP IV N-terminal domain-containing protein [Candidatus Bipolaricaulia bacterium]